MTDGQSDALENQVETSGGTPPARVLEEIRKHLATMPAWAERTRANVLLSAAAAEIGTLREELKDQDFNCRALARQAKDDAAELAALRAEAASRINIPPDVLEAAARVAKHVDEVDTDMEEDDLVVEIFGDASVMADWIMSIVEGKDHGRRLHPHSERPARRSRGDRNGQTDP